MVVRYPNVHGIASRNVGAPLCLGHGTGGCGAASRPADSRHGALPALGESLQQLFEPCMGGQTTVPKEQNTQQCPASGRSNAWQPKHS